MAARHPAVLLVEDDARLGAMVAEYLGQHELEVTVVPDGERGLAALRRGRFDVVLLDVMLPGMDGTELRARMLRDANLAHIPVIVVTAAGGLVKRALPHVAAFYRKPVSLDELVETLAEHVG